MLNDRESKIDNAKREANDDASEAPQECDQYGSDREIYADFEGYGCSAICVNAKDGADAADAASLPILCSKQ